MSSDHVQNPAAILMLFALSSSGQYANFPIMEMPISVAWQEQDPLNPILFDLAMSAELLVKDGRSYYSTVDHVIRAYTMLNGGFFYNITYVAKKTTCPVTKIFDVLRCQPHKDWADMRECTAVIWDAPQKADRKVVNYQCSGWIQVDYAIPE